MLGCGVNNALKKDGPPVKVAKYAVWFLIGSIEPDLSWHWIRAEIFQDLNWLVF